MTTTTLHPKIAASSGRASYSEASSLDEAMSRLERVLAEMPEIVVAVSGGVDSLSLMAFAHRRPGARVTGVHAMSPAVPAAATSRVREFAQEHGAHIVLLDAGEFNDEAYRTNPSNRCYFCKSHLYDAIRARCAGSIVSGANLDDLSDYRPGLDAARERAVRHPFIEAGFTKFRVRELARHLGLAEVADLPSAPCLSSRVETGIRIEAPTLALIDSVETDLRAALSPKTVRCRVRGRGVIVELDAEALGKLEAAERRSWSERIAARSLKAGLSGVVQFEVYRQGGAFLRPSS